MRDPRHADLLADDLADRARAQVAEAQRLTAQLDLSIAFDLVLMAPVLAIVCAAVIAGAGA